MNRKIAFRAWDLISAKMWEINCIHFNPDKTISSIEIALAAKKGWIRESRIQGEDLELMQFTGLTGKNGKEIYEGDIVRCGYDDADFGTHVIEYEWATFRPIRIGGKDKDGMAQIVPNRDEVIGNVFENPELLSEGKEKI